MSISIDLSQVPDMKTGTGRGKNPLFGWSTYQDFLASDEWAAIREVIVTRADARCEVCGAEEPLHVHHIVYSKQWGEEDHEELAALCERCHTQVHWLQDTVKLNRRESFLRLLETNAAPGAVAHWNRIGPWWLRRPAARNFLLDILKRKGVAIQAVKLEGAKIGLRDEDIKKAEQSLGVESFQYDGVWLWTLPKNNFKE